MAHYLCCEVMVQCLLMPIIVEVDLYKFDPYDLLKMALFRPKLPFGA